MSRIPNPGHFTTRRNLRRYYRYQAKMQHADWLVIHTCHANAFTDAEYRAWQKKHPHNRTAEIMPLHILPVRLWRWVRAHLQHAPLPGAPAH